MHDDKDLTYSEAIEKVMLNNGFYAPLKLLYEQIWNYKDKSKIVGKTPDMTIQERVQRDPRFTRIGKGVYALTDFLEKVEKEDLGFFTVNENEEIIFKENPEIKIKIIGHTDSDGAKQYNQNLSVQRAKNVQNYLFERGIATGRILVDGKGEDEPLYDNNSKFKKWNRRVEIYIIEN